jgi:DHA1 family tetracycline resistance protein-like MFS transporter
MRRAPALSFLLVTVFIDLLGLGLIVPIVPALMTDLTGRADDAARWSGLIGSGYGLLQFLTAPLLGRLADRYGRRPVLLASLTCLSIDWLGHAMASTMLLLVLCHAVAGACAGTSIVVNAYIADIFAPDDRARAYGMVGSAFGLGFVLGPVIGGLLGAVDLRLPFYCAAGLALVNVLYGAFVLPESRPGDRTTPLSLRVANPVGALLAVLRRPVLGRLTLARFADDIARMTFQVSWTFFLTYQFAWGTARIGLTMAAGALVGAVFQARAVGPAVRWLGEKRAAVAGSLIGAVGLAGFALATAPWAVHVLQGVGVLGSVAGAATQSWISRSAGAGEQGTVHGALTGTSAIAEMVVPVVAGAVLAWSLTFGLPGLVFAGAAVSAALSAALLLSAPGPRSNGE